MSFQPLTKEQYQKALGAGFSHDEIVKNELIRKQQTEVTQKPTFDTRLQKASDVVSSIFPGKKLGEALGTSLAAIGQYAKGNKEEAKSILQTQVKPSQVAGDAAQAVLFAGSMAAPVGAGLGLAGRLGANTALGAGFGLSGALAEGKSFEETTKSTVKGAGVGLALGAVGETLRVLVEKLPKRVVDDVVPARYQKPGVSEHVLANHKIRLNTDSLLNDARKASGGYKKQVSQILSQPEYSGKVGVDSAGNILNDVLNKHSSSYVTASDVLANAKKVAPNVASKIDRFSRGNATLADINDIRAALDKANSTAFGRFVTSPALNFEKELALSFQNALRDFVQTTAPNTAPIFNNWSKEITWMRAIQRAQQKGTGSLSLGDLAFITAGGVSGVLTGGVGGGVAGSILGFGTEKLLKSPAARFGLGKTLQAGQKLAPVGRVLKTEILKQTGN